MKGTYIAAVASLAICISASGTAWGQIKSSAIVGLVTDRTGAVISDAQVSVVNEDTNVAVEVRSGGSGQYVVPYMAPGRYTLTITKAGFSPHKQAGVTLMAGQETRVDAQLRVGGVDV